MLGYAIHTGRQLHEVAQERRQIRLPVTDAQRLDSAFTAVAQPAQTLAAVEERGARWSVVVNDLATALPPDAFIQSFQASHDTVTIAGAAQTGARVFEAVSASDMLTNVATVGPIRRDVPLTTSQGGTASAVASDATAQLERFTLTARVAKAAPLVPVPGRGKKK
jgi:Tfp pilus assembly protein PilN